MPSPTVADGTTHLLPFNAPIVRQKSVIQERQWVPGLAYLFAIASVIRVVNALCEPQLALAFPRSTEGQSREEK